MRIIHLSDLHLGKRVNDFSMIEDQKFILERILDIIDEEKPQAVLIAGDVYDKPLPPAEAVRLFDDFISRLSEIDTEVFIISGNHDSAERLSFGSQIMDRQGIHFAGGYDGSTRCFSLEDEYGSVSFYMLPFIKPVHVRQAFTDDEKAAQIATFTDAVAYAIEKMGIDKNERNVLIAHQFCTGAERSESEDISVGGLDNVDVSVFSTFDYTALGHLHGPQTPVADRIRYCGSPLKYSFSEAEQNKSVTIIELGEKKDGMCRAHLRTSELIPLRDMKVLKGKFIELTDKNYYKQIETNDYIRIILTDEEDVIGALGSLRSIYPNIMRLEYDNTRTRASAIVPDAEGNDSRTPLEIFAGLYEAQNGKPMDEEQSGLVSSLIEKVWRDER
ncbi:MAG: exonuclease SbcCD subunit D [Mogibacterium sp.]|nr:exonuclease SbcCD subunit D [Mogibacterium sp.]